MNNKTGIMILIMMLALTMGLSVKAYGAQISITASDAQGFPLDFNRDNYAKTAGDVIFTVKAQGLSKDERLVFDDGGIIGTLEDGVYVMDSSEKKAGETSFVDFCISSKEGLKSVCKTPYLVEFADEIRTPPKAAFHQAQKGRDAYVSIEPSDWVNTFLLIGDRGETKKIHITEKKDISLPEEGEYALSAYTIDGKGNRTFSKDLPEWVVIDKTPPVIGDIVTDSPVADDGSIISQKSVTVSVSAADDVSGLEGIYMLPEGEEPLKTGKITFDPPYRGSLQVMARDNAGNETESQIVVNRIIVDDTPPLIEAQNEGFSGGLVRLLLGAGDDLSGVKRLRASYDGKTVFENDGKKEEFMLDIRNMDYEEQKLILTAWDRAGNKAEGRLSLIKTDSTPPVITFHGVRDREVCGGDTEVYVEVSDDSSKIASYSANVFVTDDRGKMLYSSTTDSKSIKVTQSGIVKITAQASDREGNRTVSSISFVVDKDAPRIRGMEELDGRVLKSFEPEDGVSDLVEDLSLVTCEVYLNGLEYDGKPVTKDGKYVLKVTARDEFGNTSQKEADFTVKNGEKKEDPLSVNGAKWQTVSKNALKDVKKSGTVSSGRSLSEDKVRDRKLPENGTEGKKQTLSADNAVSCPENKDIKDGFLDKIKYAIIKMFGLRRMMNTT